MALAETTKGGLYLPDFPWCILPPPFMGPSYQNDKPMEILSLVSIFHYDTTNGLFFYLLLVPHQTWWSEQSLL